MDYLNYILETAKQFKKDNNLAKAAALYLLALKILDTRVPFVAVFAGESKQGMSFPLFILSFLFLFHTLKC